MFWICPQLRLAALPLGAAARCHQAAILPYDPGQRPPQPRSAVDQRKSFNATAQNTIDNTSPSSDMSLVLLQGKGHSNNQTASEQTVVHLTFRCKKSLLADLGVSSAG
jgi:hypothetical protein